MAAFEGENRGGGMRCGQRKHRLPHNQAAGGFALKIRREHEKEKEKNKKATEKLLPKEKSH